MREADLVEGRRACSRVLRQGGSRKKGRAAYPVRNKSGRNFVGIHDRYSRSAFFMEVIILTEVALPNLVLWSIWLATAS